MLRFGPPRPAIDRFPETPAFRFGVATADHQCEAYVDARQDIRDVYERNRALQMRCAATDFWNRYGEDAKLANGLGCSAFRLSLAWSRLEPVKDQWDDAAFEHYRQVLRKLREEGLEPFVTLHHNTWPIHVEHRGGMVATDFPAWFAKYAEQVATRLGDLITYYVTINEPNQLVYGYIKPWWSRAYPMPPGLPPGADTATQIGKVAQLIPNLFEANARAYDAIKAVYRANGWREPLIGANPLLLGLPAWLQRIVDRNATRVHSADDLAKQGRRLTERHVLESGSADVVIAQLTLTPDRTDDALFSEAYFVAHLALLSNGPAPAADTFSGWRGRIAAARGTTAVDEARDRFPAASVVEVAGVEDAAEQLRSGRVELVLDDDVVLRPFAAGPLVMTTIPDTDQPYAAAVAPGNRDLLQAIDTAIRDFKDPDRHAGETPWQSSVQTHLDIAAGEAPKQGRRANVANLTAGAPPIAIANAPTYGTSSLATVTRRNLLRVAVRPGIAGLCMRAADGSFVGLEPDLARFIAARLCGDPSRVQFVAVDDAQRISSVRSFWLRWLDPLLRIAAVFSTIVSTNWWSLGLAGKLAPVLCPSACVGKLDYVGLDYYWGISALGFTDIGHLFAASEQKYANAPVWPGVLRQMLHEHAQMFPDKPLFVIENGSVDVADQIPRDVYLERHIAEVQRARSEGVRVDGYLCWAITSNREWGLKFDENSNFGLYYIDLDHDPALTRVCTPSAGSYAKIIAARGTS